LTPDSGRAAAPARKVRSTPLQRYPTLTQHTRYRWRRPRRQLGEAAQVLGDGCQGELELGAARSAQSQSAEPQDALQVREQHLDALALTARLLEGARLGYRTGHIARFLIDAAQETAVPDRSSPLGAATESVFAIEGNGFLQQNLPFPEVKEPYIAVAGEILVRLSTCVGYGYRVDGRPPRTVCLNGGPVSPAVGTGTGPYLLIL
jgi:hypothetical protein